MSSRTECCVGFVFTSPAALMYGTSVRWMNTRVLAADLVTELTNRLEEREGLDVADGAADLDDDDIVLGRHAAHRGLDLIRDVRNHLHRRAEVLAAALFRDDVLVDAAGGDVVRLRERPVDEALVVAEIEIGLGAVVGDEHFAVLERRHRARIDVDVRIELEHGHAQSALDEQPARATRPRFPFPSDDTTPPVTKMYFGVVWVGLVVGVISLPR